MFDSNIKSKMLNTRFYLTRRLSKLHISFLLLCMFLCSIGASAQIFPVTLNVSGNYNFSGSMADLANGSVGNFSAHLTMNDLVVSNRDVYLKINIRGGGIDATSNPNWMLNSPVNISGGETVALSSLDLKEYFSYDNLVGISPNRYNAMLPEGTYTITFEVFDYNNPNIPISNRVFFNFTISHGLPPEIVFPTAAAGELSSNFIFMRWTPAMAYGYNITYQIEYLVDEEKNTDPLAFFHNYMYNTELVENINSTSYNFDLGSLPISGNTGRVIFRVKALTTTFTDGQNVSVIQNDGYSQIAWFDFNDGSIAGFCTEITSVSIDPRNSGTNFSTVVWQVEDEVECQEYTLSYRPANQPDITPYTFESTELKSQKVEGLEPGQSYLFTVTANCPAQLSSASTIHEQPEPQPQVTNCGEITAFDPLNIENLLTDTLKAGDTIYINNLPVLIEALTRGPESKDEIYFDAVEKLYPKIGEKPADYDRDRQTHTGYGRITFLMPLFQDKTPGVGVVFKDVYIDKNMQMLSGYAETIYKPENWTTQMANMNAFFRGGVLLEKIMNGEFKAREVLGVIGDTANIIPIFNSEGVVEQITLTYTEPALNGESSETITIDENIIAKVPKSEDESEEINYYIIKDNDNVYYGINLADGSKIPLGRYNPDINEILADINPNKVDYEYKILFSEAEAAKYDFDPADDVYQNNNIYSNHYNKLEDSDDYKLRWKFMQVDGGTDEVSVTIPDHFSDKELKFIITQNNTELAYEAGTPGSINLTLMPPPTAGVYSILAVVNAPKDGKTWQLAGRLDVLARTPKTYSVTLVSLIEDKEINETTESNVQEYLNSTWNKYGISWDVDVDDEFYVWPDDSNNKDFIDDFTEQDWADAWDDGDEFFSQYTSIQKAINRRYNTYASSKNKYDNTRMYVFVLPADKAPYNNQIGDMPLGKQWGYLFVNNFGSDEHYRTLSHELGHGRTALPHTFAGDNPSFRIEEGTTNNLMDYPSDVYQDGTDLVRAQWDMAHNPARFTPLQDDEAGAAFGDNAGDIVVVANDTIKLKDIVFGESKSYTKNYYFLDRNEKLNVSIFKMKKGAYVEHKVLLGCGGSNTIPRSTYERSDFNEANIVLTIGDNKLIISTNILNFEINANAGTSNMPEKMEINNGFTLYGDEMISLLGSSSEYPAVSMSNVIDTIRCGENILSDGFNNWVDLQVLPDVNGNAVIQVIPIIGSKREYTIKLEDAPYITISDITGNDANGKEHRLGLDNYELYKNYDKAGKSVNYIYKFDNGNKYMPYLLMTGETPANIKLELSTYDEQRVNGLCNYNFTFTNAGNKNPNPDVLKNNRFNFEIELDTPTEFKSDTTVMNRETCTLIITDNLGNIRGMVLFVKPKIDNTISYNAITLTYEDKTGSVKAGSQDYLINSHQQLGIAWNLASTTNFVITDDLIKSSYIIGDRIIYRHAIIKCLKEGTNDVAEINDFKQVINILARDVIAKGATTHTVIYLPNNLGNVGGFVPRGTIFAFMCPKETEKTLSHEFGHLLGLENHIWDDLNYTGNDKWSITNNIMGYNPSAFSFWNWQKR